MFLLWPAQPAPSFQFIPQTSFALGNLAPALSDLQLHLWQFEVDPENRTSG
jgi:hypothetical protein